MRYLISSLAFCCSLAAVLPADPAPKDGPKLWPVDPDAPFRVREILSGANKQQESNFKYMVKLIEESTLDLKIVESAKVVPEKLLPGTYESASVENSKGKNLYRSDLVSDQYRSLRAKQDAIRSVKFVITQAKIEIANMKMSPPGLKFRPLYITATQNTYGTIDKSSATVSDVINSTSLFATVGLVKQVRPPSGTGDSLEVVVPVKVVIALPTEGVDTKKTLRITDPVEVIGTRKIAGAEYMVLKPVPVSQYTAKE